jgi:putative protease
VPHEPRPGAATFSRSTLDVPEELMRSRYCIRWELGLCPKRCPVKPGMTPGVTPGLIGGPGPLYLVNQKNRLRLDFDCARCEMIVRT